MPYGQDPTEQRNLRMPPGTPDGLTAGPPGGAQTPVAAQSFDKPSMTMAPVAMNPDLAPIKQRESGGQPYVGYTPPGMAPVDLSTAPLDDTGFPIWSGNRDPKTGLMSHAAGLYQIQPGTWKPIAKELGIKDFSEESQTKVANELYRREGKTPWAASEPGGSGYGRDPVVSAGNWSVSPSAISDEQGKPDTRVVWMGPDEYKQMVQSGTEPEERSPSKSLQKSIDKGEDIKSLPELTVKLKDGQYVVQDQDGWRRADAAEKAGVQLIPVAIHGATGEAKNIVSMNGTAIPFDFKQVAPVTHADEARELREKYGIVGGALAALGTDVGDLFGGAVRSFGEGAAEGGRDIAGVGPSRPGENVSPEVVGAASVFVGAPVTKRLPLPQEVPVEGMEMVGARPAPTAGGFTPTRVSPNALANVQAINEARGIVSDRFGQGMVPPQAAQQQLDAARAMGQPLTLADVGGKPLTDLQGQIYRQGGEAAAKIEKFYQDRDATAGPRAEGAIARHFGSGTLKQTQDDLIRERSRAARPLWDEAMSGGSTLEQQFQRIWADAGKAVSQAEKALKAADAKVTQAAARQSTAGNVYSASAANKARVFAEDQAKPAAAALQQALKVQSEAAERLRAAQADGTANAPGAIWSPRLQQFLDNPRVQQGLRRGQRIERDSALAENRPLNLSEYAVIGTKPNGDWVVGAVPTMRLLAVAKEGLDALLEGGSLRNELTGRLNKEGVAVDKLRREFTAELDRLNPAYKPARDAWSGPTSSIAALQYGRDILNRGKGHYAEDVVQHIAEMTPNEKEFAKIGLAATYREKLRNVADAGDESKALANNAGTRMRIRPLFGSDEAAAEFLNFVDNERAMFDTKQRVMGGSQTAERQMADQLPIRQGQMAVEGGRAIMHAAHGNLLSALTSALRLGKLAREATPDLDPAVGNAIADLLTDPNVGIFTGDRRGILPPLQLPPVQRGNSLTALMMRLPAASKALGRLPPPPPGSNP